MQVFEYGDYKTLLAASLRDKKKTLGGRFTFRNMAKACRVESTYLSKVINHEGNLTNDQLFRAAEFLGLNKEERSYLFLLNQWQNASVPNFKKDLGEDLDKVRKKHLKTESHIDAKSLDVTSDAKSEYYLDPDLQIVHLFLTINKYRQNIKLIQEKLGISATRMGEILSKLRSLAIIDYQDGKCKVLVDNIHLSKEASIYKPHCVLVRLKSLENIFKTVGDESYNFSVVFSSDLEVRNKIQSKFMNFVKDIEGLVEKSSAEDVYQLNFDLFSWS